MVDISNPNKNTVCVSGAYYSADKAYLFAIALSGLLEKRGYHIKIGEMNS